jgi:hypothetical protein
MNMAEDTRTTEEILEWRTYRTDVCLGRSYVLLRGLSYGSTAVNQVSGVVEFVVWPQASRGERDVQKVNSEWPLVVAVPYLGCGRNLSGCGLLSGSSLFGSWWSVSHGWGVVVLSDWQQKLTACGAPSRWLVWRFLDFWRGTIGTCAESRGFWLSRHKNRYEEDGWSDAKYLYEDSSTMTTMCLCL